MRTVGTWGQQYLEAPLQTAHHCSLKTHHCYFIGAGSKSLNNNNVWAFPRKATPVQRGSPSYLKQLEWMGNKCWPRR